MKLEQQVTSRELSECLRYLGVKQESYFGWINDPYQGGWVVTSNNDEFTYEYSALTVAELGELFPANVQLPFKRPANELDKVWYEKWYWSNEEGRHEATNEAEARGLMLAYLLENKLITL